ncbi:hypothetical protein GCM10010185_34450 [Saccharothrix coeruleofusca]|uniref:Uncharacterized protein n=1 Tax=Saccharothrix coeruleofusca TaxID=33919 RepID=A0A918EET0_9PSEU|nr:hypothetical protein GCM10010185_34450 [Saccharothrix coeruleofusca]
MGSTAPAAVALFVISVRPATHTVPGSPPIIGAKPFAGGGVPRQVAGRGSGRGPVPVKALFRSDWEPP